MIHIGVFFFKENTLSLRQQTILQHLSAVYSHYGLFSRILIPLITGDNEYISLRLLDWLVTSFAKQLHIAYTCTSPFGDNVFHHVNVYQSYQNNLDMFKRKNFDPFRRRARVYFIQDDTTYTTTPGLLQFIMWAYKYGIIQYCINHKAWLSMHMIKQIHRTKHSKNKQAIKELSLIHI